MSEITRTAEILPERTIPAQPPTALVTGGHPVARALQNDVLRAAGAVRSMPDRGSLLEADVSVAAYAAVACTGPTPADALQSATNWSREATGAEIHTINLARVPGHREDVMEYRVTMSVSFQDPQTGDYTGDTHHAAGPMGYIVTSSGEAGPSTS
ncbi:hypothetical protein ACFVXQ_05410 [Kitasatospora sp. NPDC058263]